MAHLGKYCGHQAPSEKLEKYNDSDIVNIRLCAPLEKKLFSLLRASQSVRHYAILALRLLKARAQRNTNLIGCLL